MRETWTDRETIGDVVVAVLAGVAAVAGTIAVQGVEAGRTLDTFAYTWLILSAAALPWRRRHPAGVVIVSGAAGFTFYVSGYVGLIFPAIPLLVALYTAVSRGRRLVAFVVAAVTMSEFAVAKLLGVGQSTDDPQGLLFAVGFVTTALVLGEVTRSRRDYLAAVEQRAVEAERTREEEARRRAGEERLRIAREVHDVLGHSLSLINVQAGTAAHVIDRQPEKARDALETIKQSSKQALQELRGTLGALQQTEQAAPRTPAPSVTRLDDLVGPVSAAGVDVEVLVTGEPRPLPAAVDQAAYRIVQESLTNVIRHADAPTATVQVGYGKHELMVDVEDTGQGATDPAGLESGSGVAGMRERAAAMGGELQVSSDDGRGVHVRARLPLDGAP